MTTLETYKKYVVQVLAGSLIAASLVAVFSVLSGSFTDTTGKVLWTLFIVVIHALFSISLLSGEEKSTNKLEFTKNVIYSLIPLSLVTAIFGVWNLLSGDTVGTLYQLYILVAFISFHINALSLLKDSGKLIDRLALSNIIVTIIMAGLLVPVIVINDSTNILDDFYFRLLGAVAIVNGTLTVLSVIFFKLYLQRHPEAKEKVQIFQGKNKAHIWVWVLVIFILLQVVPFLVFSLGSLITRD